MRQDQGSAGRILAGKLDGQGARYAQLIRALKGAILDGRVNAGSRLPASRSLARELDLSRNTVLAAYEQLQAEGFLLGRVGSGSYVANVGSTWFRITSSLRARVLGRRFVTVGHHCSYHSATVSLPSRGSTNEPCIRSTSVT